MNAECSYCRRKWQIATLVLLFVSNLAEPSSAQELPLFRFLDKDVHEDLELIGDKSSKVMDIVKTTLEKNRILRRKQESTEKQEDRAAIASERKRLVSMAQQRVVALLTGKQRQRMKELAIQHQVLFLATAGMSPELEMALAVTVEQRGRMKDVRNQVLKASRSSGLDRKTVLEIIANGHKRFINILNDQQRDQLKRMCGVPLKKSQQERR